MTIYCIWGFIFLSFFFCVELHIWFERKMFIKVFRMRVMSLRAMRHWDPWDQLVVSDLPPICLSWICYFMNEWMMRFFMSFICAWTSLLTGGNKSDLTLTHQVTVEQHVVKLKPGSKTQHNTHWQAVGIWQKHAKICYTPCIHTPIC